MEYFIYLGGGGEQETIREGNGEAEKWRGVMKETR